MSKRHETLKKAREHMVEHSKVLAAAWTEIKAERARNKFVEIHAGRLAGLRHPWRGTHFARAKPQRQRGAAIN
jgi:hypothetical protein